MIRRLTSNSWSPFLLPDFNDLALTVMPLDDLHRLIWIQLSEDLNDSLVSHVPFSLLLHGNLIRICGFLRDRFLARRGFDADFYKHSGATCPFRHFYKVSKISTLSQSREKDISLPAAQDRADLFMRRRSRRLAVEKIKLDVWRNKGAMSLELGARRKTGRFGAR